MTTVLKILLMIVGILAALFGIFNIIIIGSRGIKGRNDPLERVAKGEGKTLDQYRNKLNLSSFCLALGCLIAAAACFIGFAAL